MSLALLLAGAVSRAEGAVALTTFSIWPRAASSMCANASMVQLSPGGKVWPKFTPTPKSSGQVAPALGVQVNEIESSPAGSGSLTCRLVASLGPAFAMTMR